MDLAEPTSLTYTTAPLKEDVNAVGPAGLDVFASSTAPETDLYAVVADVWPDGTAHPVRLSLSGEAVGLGALLAFGVLMLTLTWPRERE